MAIKFQMSAADFARLFELDMLKDFIPEDAEPVRDGMGADAQIKLVDGKPVYRVRITASERDTDREMSNVSLKIKNLPGGRIPRQFDLKLAGQVTVTPYVTSGSRQGYSVIADGFAEGGK